MSAPFETVRIESCWIKPSTILFATENPPNQRAFALALATAQQFHAKLILFHVYDTLAIAASEFSGVRYYDYSAAARIEEAALRPLAARAERLGIETEIVVRPGLAGPQILHFTQERPIDRIIMGTRAPGRLGKLFVGSVCEEVVRSAHVPVLAVGPEVMESTVNNAKIRRILTAVSLHSPASLLVAELAARMAIHHDAQLTLVHVAAPSRGDSGMPGETIACAERELRALLPEELRQAIKVECITSVGDPAEEILYQSNLRRIDLIVTGAQETSPILTIARQGVANRVIGQALCPVLTFAPPVMVRHKQQEKAHDGEQFLAGVF